MKTHILVLSSLFLVSCASTRLKPGAENVTVSDSPPAASCKEVGRVDSYTHVNVANTTKNVLTNVLKNNAYDIGANYVFLDEATSLKRGGRAYSCL